MPRWRVDYIGKGGGTVEAADEKAAIVEAGAVSAVAGVNLA
jgi:hypothetical protein